ncbi:hypothetical protein PsYK624_059900 [Phanerochaete sordida]|uniref:Uncharacterized protein n=1 Tax=Phanerochaete sordida TaxID=48140 RepID=A0A9P3LD23_9APHY|nr:hypothetical protein PsYK624_059900 [Phanerochaete sordida]
MPTTSDTSINVVLPPELTGLVFEHLAELEYGLEQPKRSLFVCSFVCKAWAERSFRHRFRTLSLHSCLFGEATYSGELTIQRFIQDELYPRSKNVVRSLLLHYNTPKTVTVEKYDFIDFASLFPSLSTLELSGILRVRLAEPPSQQGLHPDIHHLTIRHQPNLLDGWLFRDERALRDVLCSFGTIRELRIAGLPSSYGRTGAPRVSASSLEALPPPRVAAVVLRCEPVPALAPFLQWLAAAAPLQRFDVLALEDRRCRAAFDIAEALLAPPQHLLFSITVRRPTAVLHGLYNLRSLPGLKRLTIALELRTTYDRQQASLRDTMYAVNSDICGALDMALQGLHCDCVLEHLELIFTSYPNETRTPLPADFLATLESMKGTLRLCDVTLSTLARAGRVGAVALVMYAGRPLAQELEYERCVARDARLRQFFPRLDGLGVLHV